MSAVIVLVRVLVLMVIFIVIEFVVVDVSERFSLHRHPHSPGMTGLSLVVGHARLVGAFACDVAPSSEMTTDLMGARGRGPGRVSQHGRLVQWVGSGGDPDDRSKSGPGAAGVRSMNSPTPPTPHPSGPFQGPTWRHRPSPRFRHGITFPPSPQRNPASRFLLFGAKIT